MRRLNGHDGQRGYAMIMVIGIGMVLMILMVTAASVSMNGARSTKNDQDWNGALAAAYAGVDEYESRLAGDSSYGQYGNPLSAFSIAMGSKVIEPTDANPAFDTTSGGQWGTVAGSADTASFRYEVDNSQFASSGILRIRSTGKVGSETRSVIANLKGKGFIDFLYFTDFEILDPAYNLNSNGTTKCPDPVIHAWEGNRNSGCTEITFGSGDVLDGPVHSNDIIHICDATFKQKVTSSYPTAPYYKNTTGGTTTKCTTPTFKDGAPSYDSSVTMPSSNLDMQRETQVTLPEDVPRPGCLYTGPTKITFTDDGYMTVRSPWTKYTQSGAVRSPAAGVTLANCGTPGPSGLGSSTGQKIKVLDSNLVFVQGVPATASDPNYTAPSARPSSTGFPGCVGADGSTAGNGLGFPTSHIVRDWTGTHTVSEKAPSATTSYGCRSGDVFVQGKERGRMTIAASNYVYVTGDITYGDTSQNGDVLGLVGNNAVWVWNPQDTNGDIILTDSGREIDAAILSVDNTFMVQNYNTAPSRGTLTIFGAIAQRYRGIVSQSGGYIKNYKYDTRYKTSAPPKFLAPVSTTYGITTVADVAKAYDANGSPQ